MDLDIALYFSDVFEVSEDDLNQHGAFNISLITDLPLFIDPFLLFNSDKNEYRELHDGIIKYLRFLKNKSEAGEITPGLLKSWYFFGEIKQNWLGFSKTSNHGRGLGNTFARSLDNNLVIVFNNFGNEKITKGSHLEKLCLISSGIGRDMISDFTTNLIKDYLLKYTESFAKKHIKDSKKCPMAVNKAYFDYTFERWMPRRYILPFFDGDFVLLTPKDILTKDDTWISHTDMVNSFNEIPNAIENLQLREQINNYFTRMLPRPTEPTNEEYMQALQATINRYPALIDYYIKQKEENGDQAIESSLLKVGISDQLYIKKFGYLANLLNQTAFYQIPGTTKEETKDKIEFFKDVIENKGGHHIFYVNGEPIRKERDVHILFRLTWHYTPSDVSREVDDGRGPADYKISRGSTDKTLVEFKLAGNTQLKRNLQKQLEIYKKAADAEHGFKVIIFFSEQELDRVNKILNELRILGHPSIYLVDARADNKPSGSKA